MKYTFVNEQDKQQTINIPDDYIKINCRNLGISTKEAIYMYLSDEGYISDETVEQLTAKAKTAGAGAVGERKTRKAPTRKPDEIKRAMIAALAEFVGSQDHVTGCEVTNIERIIAFSIADDNYELVLQKKRKPKA